MQFHVFDKVNKKAFLTGFTGARTRVNFDASGYAKIRDRTVAVAGFRTCAMVLHFATVLSAVVACYRFRQVLRISTTIRS